MNWIQAQSISLKLRQKRMLLEAKRDTTEEQRKRNVALSIEAQERIQADQMVKEILERIQHREHERAVGAYEQLLGAFLSDVLPGERQIVMDLHTDRSAPALDIFIKKGENMPLEDAWLGTGGSVTNLLSTGLRLVALLRSDQRRFLVLDESDCWIKPTLIPQYASVVSQMAQELGVQILMISHHDESLFAQHIPHRLRLTRNKGQLLLAEWSPTSDIPQWGENTIGLRGIGLKDFQSHQNTLIPLAPGVTLLQGDNDIGKSAVVNALRAVFDADANDTLIKHHAPFAQVTLDFGPEHLLTWQRFRKGKVKCSYKLLDTNTHEVIHATDGTRIPEWLSDTLKIGKVDGLDIQIGQQQDPVFLLNQPASTRAKALSIGQESGHVNNMMSFDRQELQEARSSLKRCERDLEIARRYMMVFDQLSEYNYDSFDQEIEKSVERKTQYTSSLTLLHRWKKAKNSHSILDIPSVEELRIPVPRSVQPLEVFNVWQYAYQKYKCVQKIKEHSNIPSHIPQNKSLPHRHLLNQWRKSFNTMLALKLTPIHSITLPQKQAVQPRSILNQWKQVYIKYIAIQDIQNPVSLPKNIPHPQSLRPEMILNQWKQVYTKYIAIQDIQHRSFLPIEPPRPQSELHRSLMFRWRESSKLINCLNLIELSHQPSIPLDRYNDKSKLLLKWQRSVQRYSIINQYMNVNLSLPQHQTRSVDLSMLELWGKAKKAEKTLTQQCENIQDKEIELENQMNLLFPVCPTCQRRLSDREDLDLISHDH